MTEKTHIRLWVLEKLVPKDPSETAATKPAKGHKPKPRKVLRELRECLFTHSSQYVHRQQKKLKLQPTQKLIGLLEGTGIWGYKHWLNNSWAHVAAFYPEGNRLALWWPSELQYTQLVGRFLPLLAEVHRGEEKDMLQSSASHCHYGNERGHCSCTRWGC